MSSISRVQRLKSTYDRISATRSFRYSISTAKFVFRHKLLFSSVAVSAYAYDSYLKWKKFVANRDSIPESLFLHWKIYPGAIVEAKAGSHFLEKFVADDGSSAELPHVMTTFEVIRALKRIQTDDRVKGIFADFSAETPAGLAYGSNIGLAQIEELQRALHECKQVKDERFRQAWEAEHGPIASIGELTDEGGEVKQVIEAIISNENMPILNAQAIQEGSVVEVEVLSGPETFRTIAYADSFSSQGTYLFASAFEEVYIQPAGTVPLVGVSASIPFYAKLLEWIGIKFHADAKKEYKSMVSPYITHTLPEKQKENEIELLSDINNILISYIARNRLPELMRHEGVQKEEPLAQAVRKLHELSKVGPISAAQATEVGLINGTAYKDQLLSDLKIIEENDGVKRWGFYHYASVIERSLFGGEDSPKQYNVGVVYLLGEISSLNGPFSTPTVLRGLREAAEDPNIDAIVLRVDSPGGGVLESDTIWGTIQDIRERKGKIVVTSMANMAASGGYMVSAPTDYIVCSPSTVTGSIGVASLRPILTQTLFDRIMVSFDHFTIGSKDDSVFFEPDQDMLKRYDDRIEEYYLDFKRKVCAGRGIDENLMDYLAGGRVMTGLRIFEFGANKTNLASVQKIFPVVPITVDVSRSGPSPPAKEVLENLVQNKTSNVLEEIESVAHLDPDQETSPFAPPTPCTDEIMAATSDSLDPTTVSSPSSTIPIMDMTDTEEDFPLGEDVIHRAIGRGLVDALGGISDSANIAAEMAINRAFLLKKQESPEKSNADIMDEIIPGIPCSEEDGKMSISMDVNLKVFPSERGFFKSLIDDIKRGDSLEEPQAILRRVQVALASWMYDVSRTILSGYAGELKAIKERELRIGQPKYIVDRPTPRIN